MTPTNLRDIVDHDIEVEAFRKRLAQDVHAAAKALVDAANKAQANGLKVTMCNIYNDASDLKIWVDRVIRYEDQSVSPEASS